MPYENRTTGLHNLQTEAYIAHTEIKWRPINEQCEICKILDLTTELIKIQQIRLKTLEQLVKSRFVEIFGDPKLNDKHWEEAVISDLFVVKGGKRIPKGMSYSNSITNHPYLRASDMKNETILDDDIHYIDDDVFKHIQRYTVNGGDIYLTNVGVNLGMAGIIPEKYNGANLTENAVKLVPKKKEIIDGLFLAHYINSTGIQEYINERKMSVGVPKLAIFRIETMPLLIPPIELQRKFNLFVAQAGKLKLTIQQSLEELKTLKKSLMQKYFNGVLKDLSQMKKNNGKEYELLVQQVYQMFFDYENDEYRKIKVERNVPIIGKSGAKHQIDVCWEFEVAGMLYKTIIEVKDWKTKVKKEQIMSFKAKLDDISDHPSGIFVSRNGFQSGAIIYAAYNDIHLVCIEETDKINHMIFTYCFQFPHIEKLSVAANEKWLILEKNAKGICDEIAFPHQVVDAVLCDDNNNHKPFVSFIKDAQKPYINDVSGKKNHIIYEFKEPWYILTKDLRLPKVLLKGFEFDFYVTESKEVKEYHPNNAVDYILRDLTKGKQTSFNSVHGVIDKDE